MNNEIGLFDTISADYIVAGAKMELDLTSTTTQDFYLENKVNEGIGALRSAYTLIPSIAVLEIDPDTFSAKLPKGFVRLMGKNSVRILDNTRNQSDNGTVILGTTSPIGNSNGFYKGDLAINFTAQVVDGYLYFGSAITQTMCEISYVGTNIDANGELKIPALAYRPLLAFVCSEWLFKNNDPKSQKWDLRWKQGKSWFKGIMAQPDAMEAQLLGYMNNHMATYGQGGYWVF
jgi:hypothetical protein